MYSKNDPHGTGTDLMTISPSILCGSFRDVLTDDRGYILEDYGWRSNRIVQNCHVLLAALLKRDRGYSGILYWAIGEGLSSWDSRIPSPSETDTQLSQEIARKTMPVGQIIYLDDAQNPTQTPSPRLDIRCTFTENDLNLHGVHPLREFGLFGGNATEATNSGLMIDRVIHPRIDFGPGMTLTRQVRLIFGSGDIGQEKVSGFGAALPVQAIDGIDGIFAQGLNNANVQNLSDLSRLDPRQRVGNIPPVKLHEFRAKARLVARLAIDLGPLTPLSNTSISQFLGEQPQALASSIHVSPDRVVALQEQCALLQVALDDEELQRITLGDLIAS